ncbi:MAG: hypothetical protein JXN65_03460 [Clostridia bacterium]|nr:hypothetical protein [Clostridia bacterium]
MKLLRFFIVLSLVFLFPSCSGQDESSVSHEENTDVSATATDTQEKASPQMTSMPLLSRSDYHYTVLRNDELISDDTNPSLPGFVDIVSFKKIITDTEITLFIEMRELPETFRINQTDAHSDILEYSWRVNFDADYDDTISYDISLVHQKFRDRQKPENNVEITDPAFQTVGIQHQVNTGQNIAEGSIEIEGNTIIMKFDTDIYPDLKIINENTPVFIFIEYNSDNVYLYDLIPRQ